MTYIDYYLKAKDQTELEAAIPDGFIGALDIVGATYRDDTPDGQPPVARNGYLANLRLPVGVDVPESLQPFLIGAPQKPVRVWA